MQTTNENQFFRFDDLTIEKEAHHLPEDCREDYRYIKAFLRDECAKSLDIFIEKLRTLGIESDKTTWGKIMRGRLNRDRNGDPTEHPVVAYPKFKDYVRAVRDNTRIEALRGRIPFIETDTTRQMFNYIKLKWAPETVNKFGFIIGSTGSGKSAAASEFRRRNNHGACVHLEATESQGASEFIHRLCAQYGISPRSENNRLRAQLWSVISARNCIIIDNAQELWIKGTEDQPKFSMLRRLQDERGCTIILIVTPIFERGMSDSIAVGYFEQFIGRSGGTRSWLRLPEFPPADDCVTIARSLGLQDAAKYKKQLGEIAREPGRIRRLFEDLQTAKRSAQADGKPFTWDYVLETRGEE